VRLAIRYRGEALGRLNDDTGEMLFQYDDSFLAKRLELSPFHLPLRSGVAKTRSPFEGDLPGLFADSLPDYWGRTIMDRRLREVGIQPENVSVLKRLALVGTGGLGALTYHPEETTDSSEATSINEAMSFARCIIKESPDRLPGTKALQEAGSNPGGRFPKLLVDWNKQNEKLIVGSSSHRKNYKSCILKLDMRHLQQPHLRNAIRDEYHLLSAARKAGIDTTDHWLLEGENENGPYAHLLVERFDRRDHQRIHTHTFGGITHQLAARYGSSYEDLIRATLAATKDHREVVQQFRRMVFNVVSGNQDDHVRNHSFQFDDQSGWSLTPAYDLTSTPKKEEHALSINGKWTSIDNTDLKAVARLFSIESHETIIEQCREALAD